MIGDYVERESCTDLMPDVVLEEIADRFVFNVAPHIKFIKFSQYLTSPKIFDSIADHLKNGGSILVAGSNVSLQSRPDIVH